MVRLRTPATLAVLAFALTACGQEQPQPVQPQNQPVPGVRAPAEQPSPVKRDRRQDGPVYNGKTY